MIHGLTLFLLVGITAINVYFVQMYIYIFLEKCLLLNARLFNLKLVQKILSRKNKVYFS